MVTAALDALIGDDPDDALVAAAVTTIPAAELPDALRLLAREHGPTAVPILARCLRGRPEWAVAAADALATLPTPETAGLLAAAEKTALSKPVRTAVRRALYRLRQRGVAPPAPAAAPWTPAASGFALRQAWASGLDGTGSRGFWLVVGGTLGEHTRLSAILNDTVGVLEFAATPIAKRRLDEQLRLVRAESPLPWVSLPPAWALHLLVEAASRHASAAVVPGDLARWLARLPAEAAGVSAPIYAEIPAAVLDADPALLDESAALLAVPDLGGWFLDPAAVQTEALELLQAQESRLVVSDQIKAERVAAIVDRVIDAHFTPEVRQRWRRRLEEEAYVLLETDRPAEARQALAVAGALSQLERPARHLPFVRALVERSLEIAGEVALGRVPAADVSRVPRPAGPAPAR